MAPEHAVVIPRGPFEPTTGQPFSGPSRPNTAHVVDVSCLLASCLSAGWWRCGLCQQCGGQSHLTGCCLSGLAVSRACLLAHARCFCRLERAVSFCMCIACLEREVQLSVLLDATEQQSAPTCARPTTCSTHTTTQIKHALHAVRTDPMENQPRVQKQMIGVGHR